MGTSSYEKRKELVKKNEMKLYRKKFFNIDISFRTGVRRGSENLGYNMDVCVKF